MKKEEQKKETYEDLDKVLDTLDNDVEVGDQEDAGKIRTDAVSQILNEPLHIEIVFEDYRFWRRIRVLPRSKTFLLKALYLGSFLKISRILEGVNLTRIELERTNLELAVKYANLHMADYIKIVAIGLHNQKSEPPKSILRALEWHVNTQQLLEIVQAIVTAMDCTPFTSTIILTSGMSLLKEPELIADQAPGA